MTNAFGVVLDSASLRRATIEGVSETVIAAIYFLHERSVDEIVTKLRPSELEGVSETVIAAIYFLHERSVDEIVTKGPYKNF